MARIKPRLFGKLKVRDGQVFNVAFSIFSCLALILCQFNRLSAKPKQLSCCTMIILLIESLQVERERESRAENVDSISNSTFCVFGTQLGATS